MKKPKNKDITPPDYNSAVEEFLYPKRLQAIMTRRKNLYPKKTLQRRIFPVSDEGTDEVPVGSSVSADINAGDERSLQKIKMEITFSDKSTLEKEIILSDKSAADKKVIVFDENAKEADSTGDGKIPWATVVILAVIVVASLVTGIYHWYSSYFQPSDSVPPEYIDKNPDNTINAPVPTPGANTADNPASDTADPEIPVMERPAIDPLPEFLLLWEEHGNEDIVAVLNLAETEFLVVQSNDNAFYITHDINRNYSSSGWVFLDYQVDLFMGLEHNMVIFDPVGGFMREAIQEYAEYDHYLEHPTILFSTLYGDFEWEIFAFYVAPVDFPFAVVNHPTDDIWGEAVEQFTLVSLYNTMLDVTMYDQILTIAVPTNIDPELFYILQARMLRQITS